MRFHWKIALIVIVVYLVVFAYLLEISGVLAAALGIYCIACMIALYAIIKSAESRRSGNVIEFSRSHPASILGYEWGQFQHVFHTREPVTEVYHRELSRLLRERFECPGLEPILFKDVDHELQAPESRTFLLTPPKDTVRGSGISLLCNFTQHGTLQGVHWWIFVKGHRDPNKLFLRYSLSPLQVPFIVLPYLRREYDPLGSLTSIYPGFFNSVDITTRTRELQYVAFETLVDVLDSFGVDTSDLKQQRASVMNIQVSGGQTNFGAIVQGAFNKVKGGAGGKGAAA